MNKENIIKTLIQAKKDYYSGKPTMSDAEFDELEDMLKIEDHNNDYFSLIGSPGPTGKKVKHKYPMFSLNKGKTIEDIMKWFKKLNVKSSILAEPKIDGVSGKIVYNNGRLVRIATRGDGERGQDITHVINYVPNIPINIIDKDRVEVRGEFYLPKVNAITKTKLRNVCSGLLGRKDNLQKLSHARFVAYQLLGVEHDSESSKFVNLEEYGFYTVDFKVIEIDQIEAYYKKYLESLRASWNYETDGLVMTINEKDLHEKIDAKYVVEHHHHYNIALKPPSVSKETKLIKVNWSVSKNGNLIPVAEFEPIEIGGVEISKATLNNREYLQKLKLNIGDTILIERANDVIPHVVKNMNPKKRLTDIILEDCPHCGTPTEYSGIHTICSNEDCQEISIQKTLFWCNTASMEGIKEGTIRRLYKAKKIEDAADLYYLSKSDFKGIEGFQEKSINKIINEIEKSKHVTLPNFISRIGIPLVGLKALKKLKIKNQLDFEAFDDETYKIGEAIIKWKEKNWDYYGDLLEALDIIIEEDIRYNGKTVCMTGKGPKSRKELILEIRKKGYAFEDSVNRDVNILICEDINGSSSKLQKARKLGIELVAYTIFFK